MSRLVANGCLALCDCTMVVPKKMCLGSLEDQITCVIDSVDGH